MDIQLSIKKVLEKYNIRVCGETYQDTINAKVRSNLLNIINKNKKISIRGVGEHTRQLLKLVPELNIEYIFDRNVESRQTCIINNKQYKLLSNDYIKNVDCIIVSSFAHRIKMSNEIKKINPNVQVIDIYNILNFQNCCVNEPFYKITDESYESFIFYRNRFEENNTSFNLMSVIKSCVDICDFILFEKYCNIYIPVFDSF